MTETVEFTVKYILTMPFCIKQNVAGTANPANPASHEVTDEWDVLEFGCETLNSGDNLCSEILISSSGTSTQNYF